MDKNEEQEENTENNSNYDSNNNEEEEEEEEDIEGNSNVNQISVNSNQERGKEEENIDLGLDADNSILKNEHSKLMDSPNTFELNKNHVSLNRTFSGFNNPHSLEQQVLMNSKFESPKFPSFFTSIMKQNTLNNTHQIGNTSTSVQQQQQQSQQQQQYIQYVQSPLPFLQNASYITKEVATPSNQSLVMKNFPLTFNNQTEKEEDQNKNNQNKNKENNTNNTNNQQQMPQASPITPFDGFAYYNPIPFQVKQELLSNEQNKKIQDNGNKINKDDMPNRRWTKEEHQSYLQFCEENKDLMTDTSKKKKQKVYKMMAKFIKTRTATQCRTHDQKFSILKKSGINNNNNNNNNSNSSGIKKQKIEGISNNNNVNQEGQEYQQQYVYIQQQDLNGIMDNMLDGLLMQMRDLKARMNNLQQLINVI